MGVEGMDPKSQAMSVVGSFRESQSDSHTLHLWSRSGAHVHQALGGRAAPPSTCNTDKSSFYSWPSPQWSQVGAG